MNKFLLLSACVLSLGVSACSNTFHGAGRDVENAGESVQRAVPAK